MPPPSDPAPDGPVDRLLAIFERQEPDGSFHFADRDVRHFIPRLLLACGRLDLPPDASPPLRAIVAAFRRAAGIADGASESEVRAATDGYYAAHPPHPELAAAFERFLADEGARLGGS